MELTRKQLVSLATRFPFVAVDPGLKGNAYAFFRNNKLYCIWFQQVSSDLPLSRRIRDATSGHNESAADFAVMEFPRIYPGSQVDPDAILKIAAVVGATTMALGIDVYYPAPAEWKGQETKEVTEARVVRKLDANEKRYLESVKKDVPVKNHNDVIDAIAIGLWALGRD